MKTQHGEYVSNRKKNTIWTTQSQFLIGVESGSVSTIRHNLEQAEKDGLVGAASGNGNTAFFVAVVRKDFYLMEKVARISAPDDINILKSIHFLMENKEQYSHEDFAEFKNFFCDLIIKEEKHELLNEALIKEYKNVIKFFHDHVGQQDKEFVKGSCIHVISEHQDDDFPSVVEAMFKHKLLVDPNIIDPENDGIRFIENLAVNGCPRMTEVFINHGATVKDETVDNIISGLFGGGDIEREEEHSDSLKCLITALLRMDISDLKDMAEAHKNDKEEERENLSLVIETVAQFRSPEIQEPKAKRFRGEGENMVDDEKEALRQDVINYCNLVVAKASTSITSAERLSPIEPRSR